MPRRIAYPLAFAASLAFTAAAAGLVWAGWPGRHADPATLINRFAVIATVAMLAGLPWVIRRRFGPVARTWRALIVRACGYAAVLGLMLAETEVARFEYAGAARRHLLVGVWAGEILFLAVLAAYVAWLLAVTAQCPPAAPGALAIGARAGAAAGLIMYVLPPMGHPLNIANIWLTRLYDAARVLALLLAFGITIHAGIAAARRTRARGGRLPVTDVRARHGVAAGLCAGAVAALIVCVLGASTAALVPHKADSITWTLPDQNISSGGAVDQHLSLGLNVRRHLSPTATVGPHLSPTATVGRHLSPAATVARHPAPAPGAVYEFEVGVSDSGAGYLAVLLLFPVFGAGLGAWGGLYGAGQPRRRPGGGGGGGPRDPDPVRPPPDEDTRRDDERLPALLRGGYLRELPVTEGLSPEEEQQPVAPAGTGAHARSGPRQTLDCGDGGEPGPPGG